MVMTGVCRETNKDDLTNVGRYGCQRARGFVSRNVFDGRTTYMNRNEQPAGEQRETIRAMIRDT